MFSYFESENKRVCVLSHISRFWRCASPGTIARQAPLSIGFPGKNTDVVAMVCSRGSSQPRDGTHLS